MSSVKRLAEQVQCRLNEVLPKLRKTVVGKLALVVGAMIENKRRATHLNRDKTKRSLPSPVSYVND